jgi:hypothetical protein
MTMYQVTATIHAADPKSVQINDIPTVLATLSQVMPEMQAGDKIELTVAS